MLGPTGIAAILPLALAFAVPSDGEPRVTYVGRVLEPGGAPLEGAHVFPREDRGQTETLVDETGWRGWADVIERPLCEEDRGAHEDAPATTGPDGRFALSGQRDAEPLGVLVYHPRFRPRLARPKADVAAPDGTVDLGAIVLERGREVAVTVADEAGRPIAGATVAVQPFVETGGGDETEVLTEGFAGRCRVATTDSAGRARVEGLEALVYGVAAVAPPRPAGEARVDLRRAERAALSLTVRAGRPLRVLATDRNTGTAVAGARVTVERLSSRFGSSRRFREGEAATDDRGEAVFDLAPDADFRVTVRAPDAGKPPSPGQLDPYALWKTARAGDSLEFVLDSIVPLAFSVRDAETGAGVAGARARLTPVRTEDAAPFGWPTVHTARCDGVSERLVVTGIRPGRWEAEIDADGYAPAAISAFDVGQGGLPEPIPVELAPAREVIRGRVVSEDDGAPIADAVVRALEGEWGVERETRTGDDGGFLFERSLGFPHFLFLSATAPGHREGFARFERGGARPPEGIEIRLVPSSAVEGRVVDAAGAPLAYRAVRAAVAGAVPPFPRVTRTDAAGRFRFDDAIPGRLRVSSGEAAAEVEVRAGETATVELVVAKP